MASRSLPLHRAAALWSLCRNDCPCAEPCPLVERSALSDTPRPPQDSRYWDGLDPHSLDRHPKPPDPRRHRHRRVPMQSGLSLRTSGRHRRLSDPRRPRRDLRRSHGAHRTGLPCACWPCASCCRTNSAYRPLTIADGAGVGFGSPRARPPNRSVASYLTASAQIGILSRATTRASARSLGLLASAAKRWCQDNKDAGPLGAGGWLISSRRLETFAARSCIGMRSEVAIRTPS